MPNPNGVELATNNAEYYGIPPQNEGETNTAFRSRVSGALRGKGMFIEAHESYNNRYHDEPDATGECPTAVGILGAVASVMHPENHIGKTLDDERNIGDDVALGSYIKHRKSPDVESMELQILLTMLGGMK